jgi:septum formation protein
MSSVQAGPDEPRLILASASPRRSELLRQIGIAHRIVPADIDESALPGESLEACVRRLAAQKALSVQAAAASSQAASGAALLPVLGADTVVVIDGELLGKPRDREDALRMLRRLSGRSHQVLSAVALALPGSRPVRCLLCRSEVRFRSLGEQECAVYCDSGEPLDKAGAYAIQGRAAVFVEQLQGSYSGVMGLPLLETASLLGEAGIGWWQPATPESAEPTSRDWQVTQS